MNRKLYVLSASDLSFRELIYLIAKKIRRKFGTLTGKPKRYEWTFEAVIDATGPELLLRNYLEHRDLREYLKYVQSSCAIKKAADVGCGFGRLEMLLSEFAEETTGFEREGSLLETARLLLPGFMFKRVETLTQLPCVDAQFDLVLTFTVLQHLTDQTAERVAKEIKRITRPGGFVLLCEQTDEEDRYGDASSESTLIECGRALAIYESWMKPFSLLKTSARLIEPTYARQEVGLYMLFRKPI